MLILLLAVTVTLARNLRCPANLDTNELVANQYDSTKYFMCTAAGILEERQCEAGDEFDKERLVCSLNYAQSNVWY